MPINPNARINDQIRISPLRIIGPDNEQIGIMTNTEALARARDLGLDLVEVAPQARPPVCRMMDYGKWKYSQKKNVKKSHEQTLKEVRLRPKTDSHDREIKIKRATRFLKKGHKVQFTMIFRGRERSHREIGFQTFQSILVEFGQRVKVERSPSVEGRLMVMIVAPVKGAFDDVADADLEVEDDDTELDAELADAEGDDAEETAPEADDAGETPAAEQAV